MNCQVAWRFDLMGKETAAISFYDKAIKLGLKGADSEGAYIGLGGTYRSIGLYNEAEATLQKGIKEFPDNKALKVFYGMVLYNLYRHSEVMSIILSILAATSKDETIAEYQKAVHFYADRLDETLVAED